MKKCHDCAAPALSGYSRCEKHREAARASSERKISARVALGLCGRCGKRAVQPEMKACRRCLDITQTWREDHKPGSTLALPGQLPLPEASTR